jgi:hypothetical protein
LPGSFGTLARCYFCDPRKSKGLQTEQRDSTPTYLPPESVRYKSTAPTSCTAHADVPRLLLTRCFASQLVLTELHHDDSRTTCEMQIRRRIVQFDQTLSHIHQSDSSRQQMLSHMQTIVPILSFSDAAFPYGDQTCLTILVGQLQNSSP